MVIGLLEAKFIERFIYVHGAYTLIIMRFSPIINPILGHFGDLK